MIVYRITLAKYADKLFSPGTAGRWNDQGRFVIYTAGSVSLACLENLVHRSAIGLQADYKVMYIEIPPSLEIIAVNPDALGDNWEQLPTATRRLGNAWLENMKSCVLRVPSAIVQNEFNYLLNPTHPLFSQISLLGTEAFTFDRRLKV